MTGSRLFLAALLAASASTFACGDDSETQVMRGGRDSGASSDRDAGRPPRDAGGSARDAAGGGDEDAGGDDDSPCVVALHVDDCCASYEPVRRSEVEGDECLQAVPASSVFGSDLVKRCMMKAGASCDPARCNTRSLPPSRIAVADGARCRYAHECRDDSDCVPAVSVAGCCNCPAPLPAQLLELNACVVEEGTPANEWPLGCPGCNLPVDCSECPDSKPARCQARGELNVCTEAK